MVTGIAERHKFCLLYESQLESITLYNNLDENGWLWSFTNLNRTTPLTYFWQKWYYKGFLDTTITSQQLSLFEKGFML